MKRRGNIPILWVIATFVLALLPQLTHMPPAVALTALLAPAWRIAAEWRDWKPLPPLLRHTITLGALALLFFSYGDLSGRRAAVSLLALMLSLKLIECYRVRDARLLVSFSLFLCATQYLFSQSLPMLFYGGAVISLALVTLARLQRSEAWAHSGEPPQLGSSLLSEMGFSLRILALAVPAALAFFVLFPRLAAPLWGIPETTLDSRSGLSDSMSPGSIQQLFMDDSPAFRATFEGLVPAQSELYWRGPVLWSFDGKTWEPGFYGRNLRSPYRTTHGGRALRYTVQMEPNEREWLFALDYPTVVPGDAFVTLDFQVLRRDPVIQLLQYSITSVPDLTDSPRLPETLRDRALELPEDRNPRTRQMVARWRRETPDNEQFIRRVLDWFNQQPYHYSLDSPILGHDPVDEFLFDTRTGYCEHYASSFAVMMRMAGIPARIVTGYQGGWFNPLGGYLLVRQSDAHAWTEVWLSGHGWTRIDPTAAVSPLRVESGPLDALSSPRHWLDFGWMRQLRNSADVVQQRWNIWVIEYSASRQARLFSPFGFDHLGPAALMAALFAVLAVFGVILLPLAFRVRGPDRKDPVRLAWKKFLRRLEAAGFKAPLSHGAGEIARSAAQRLPGAEQPIQRIAELYTRCRYSPASPPVHALQQEVRAFHPKRKAG